MFWQKTNKDLNLADFTKLVSKAEGVSELKNVMQTIFKYRSRLKILRDQVGSDLVFRLLELSTNDGFAFESEFFKQNLPPLESETISPERLVWIVISAIIFEVNPKFSDNFPKRLFDACLTRPTNLAFALGHSDSIASLAKHHPNLLNSSLIELIISSIDDSRSIYALKIARWLPNWSDVSGVAFCAMIVGGHPKQIEAMWLVNERSNIDEVILFCGKNQIVLPNIIGLQPNIHTLTNAIVKVNSKRVSYAVNMDGKQLCSEELTKLSTQIANLIEPDKPNNS